MYAHADVLRLLYAILALAADYMHNTPLSAQLNMHMQMNKLELHRLQPSVDFQIKKA